MKFFDLHNDALTCGMPAEPGDIIYAVWTTELSRMSAVRLFSANTDKMLAVEDCGKLSVCDIPDGVKYCGLTWNGFNGLAGGAYSSEHLTESGKAMIDGLNSRHIPIDTAHLNRVSFYEVAERADKIICSHTCFDAVKSHLRNLTKEQISVIIQRGGIIGLCFVTEFLGGDGIDDILRHLDWFLTEFGDGNLCFGTDFYGTSNLPKGINGYKNIEKLVLSMIKHGYSDSTISKIMYSNAADRFCTK